MPLGQLGRHACAWLLATIGCGIAGCATTGAYERSLDAWKGRPQAELVNARGTPAETFNSDGHTFLVYLSSTVVPFTFMPNTLGAHADHTKSKFCTTVFDVSGGVIVGWALKGNDCANEQLAPGAPRAN
jgi:hypothetical protein